MKKYLYHIVIPVIMPVLFFLVAATPVEVLGCRTRGLIAIILAFASALAALATTIIGTRMMRRRDKNYAWWLISTSILIVPVIALLILA